MRLVVGKESLRRILRWTHRTLMVVGVAVLGYCGFILADAWMFQRRANAVLESKRQEAPVVHDASRSLPPAIGPNGLIGRLEIPRIGLSAIVIEGVDRTTLRRAAGHIPQTGMPGRPGNIGLAGHRDTFFRPLRNIVRDDVITFTTLSGEYRYRVVSLRVVTPAEVSVLHSTENEVLTLVTCYPFYVVGSAPDRFIVRAERVI
jgi:sortase A